jgi:hypothetical protein
MYGTFQTNGLSLHRDNTQHRSSDIINSFLNTVFGRWNNMANIQFPVFGRFCTLSLEVGRYVTVKNEDMVLNPLTAST